MIKFSEYVSLGHPDKIADYISQYILDRFIEADPGTRYAVEVQIKDRHVTLGGEVSSNFKPSNGLLRTYVRDAVNEIGYTDEYQRLWGAENTICGNELQVVSHISIQSPDIAQGLSGWGDQGIFYGYCEYRPDTCGMPLDHAIAKRLCKDLFESGIGGLDIKTQVIMRKGKPETVIVAIPLMPGVKNKTVRSFIKKRLKGHYKIIVNGTGQYIRHSTIADCGTTGRKLVVDFYGGNCQIGGGSPWTKDGTKADLSLNLLARRLAVNYSRTFKTDVTVSLACCIGRTEVEFVARDKAGTILSKSKSPVLPHEVIEDFNLNTPIFASMCRWGLFGEFQQDKGWE